MDAIEKMQDAALKTAHEILSEHFEHFALCVADNDYDSFRWDYSCEMMGKAMFERGAKEVKSMRDDIEDSDFIWDEEEGDEI